MKVIRMMFKKLQCPIQLKNSKYKGFIHVYVTQNTVQYV